MKRFKRDPFDPVQSPRWLVVRDRHTEVLESTRLDPLTNLRIVFLATVLNRMNKGWTAEDFGPAASVCYLTKGAERISISIDWSDPEPNDKPVDDRPVPWNVVELKPRDGGQ